jgi:hypothetical protein
MRRARTTHANASAKSIGVVSRIDPPCNDRKSRATIEQTITRWPQCGLRVLLATIAIRPVHRAGLVVHLRRNDADQWKGRPGVRQLPADDDAQRDP